MNITTHDQAIEKYKEEIGATRVHVDYNPQCDPQDLYNELIKCYRLSQEADQIDPYVRLQAINKRYEGIINRIAKLCQMTFAEYDELGPRGQQLRDDILKETTFYSAVNPQDIINFAAEIGQIKYER